MDSKKKFIYNEIIDLKEYKEYKKSFETGRISRTANQAKDLQAGYKKIFKVMQERIFKGKRMLVFNYENGVKLTINDNDKKIIALFKELKIDISEEQIFLGFFEDEGKQKSIITFLSQLENNLNSLPKKIEMAAKAKKPNEALLKNIEQLKIFEKHDGANLFNIYKRETNYGVKDLKIVITWVPRKVASQSTKVQWTSSCQNLNGGGYREFVFPGMYSGQFIAYLVKENDANELKNPQARVLLKVYNHVDDPEKMIWLPASRIYGNDDVRLSGANESFHDKVTKIILKLQNKTFSGKYKFNTNQYNDGDIQEVNVIAKPTKGNNVLLKDKIEDGVYKQSIAVSSVSNGLRNYIDTDDGLVHSESKDAKKKKNVADFTGVHTVKGTIQLTDCQVVFNDKYLTADGNIRLEDCVIICDEKFKLKSDQGNIVLINVTFKKATSLSIDCKKIINIDGDNKNLKEIVILNKAVDELSINSQLENDLALVISGSLKANVINLSLVRVVNFERVIFKNKTGNFNFRISFIKNLTKLNLLVKTKNASTINISNIDSLTSINGLIKAEYVGSEFVVEDCVALETLPQKIKVNKMVIFKTNVKKISKLDMNEETKYFSNIEVGNKETSGGIWVSKSSMDLRDNLFPTKYRVVLKKDGIEDAPNARNRDVN